MKLKLNKERAAFNQEAMIDDPSAFLKATYVRAKYDIWHAPAGESHATNAQRQGNSDKNANTK